jgi:hypothetical protein
MTVEELKNMGLTFGNAKLLKKGIDALAASSSSATVSSLAAAKGGGGGAGGGGGGGAAAAVGGGGAASSSSSLSSSSLALVASELAPFISRVMDADDEDLDLRSPIEVRAGRRSACNRCERWRRVTDASRIAGAREAAAGDVC